MGLLKRASLLSKAKTSLWFAESQPAPTGCHRPRGKAPLRKHCSCSGCGAGDGQNPEIPKNIYTITSPNLNIKLSWDEQESSWSVPPWLSLQPLHMQDESRDNSTNPQEILRNISSSRAPQQEAQSAPERHSTHSSIPERAGWLQGEVPTAQAQEVFRGFGPEKPKCSQLSNAHPGTALAESPNALSGKRQHLGLSVAPFRLGALCK